MNNGGALKIHDTLYINPSTNYSQGIVQGYTIKRERRSNVIA
jgi:hypothetical protein